MQYQRGQCAIHLDTPNNNLNGSPGFIARELANVRDNGLSKEEFDALLAQKNDQLSKLFATYARTDTDVLMSQRLRSQQSGWWISRRSCIRSCAEFLSSLTLETLNQALKLQLSQEATLVLMQPKGEPEMSMKQLQETYDGIMMPAPAVVTEEAKPADTAVAAPATDAGAQ